MSNTLDKLVECAAKGELLQKHAAGLAGSGCRHIGCIGRNHYEVSKYSNNDPSVHAEMDVIKKFIQHENSRSYNDAKIRRKLRKLKLFVIRLNNVAGCENEFRNSAPCFHCLSALRNYGIKKIAFSTDEGGSPQCKKDKSNV
jgi:tRNA(Arg) A34 adenosine deaminase TadA